MIDEMFEKTSKRDQILIDCKVGDTLYIKPFLSEWEKCTVIKKTKCNHVTLKTDSGKMYTEIPRHIK